jgi:hypothetical protein
MNDQKKTSITNSVSEYNDLSGDILLCQTVDYFVLLLWQLKNFNDSL